MSVAAQPTLVRAIGRWTLAALVINTIIGSGIFGLPDDIARLVGTAAPIAYLIAAAGIGIIMACFAEVASQFHEAGGPYLYAREAFGGFAGVQMGWCAWLVRLTSAAANANLFVIYSAEFWPAATSPVPRAAILTLLLWTLAGVNIRGVKTGARVSNMFTIGKLLPLLLFIVSGILLARGGSTAAPVAPTTSDWLQAVLALMFSFGGFEAALMPMSEAKDPRRDAPFALLTALAAVSVIYTLVQVVVMRALPDPGASERPLADAARVFLGPGGAALIAAGAMVSTLGYLSGQFVSAPRLTFAFAENRDFPQFFGVVHPRFRTPHVSILIYTMLVWGLAIYGSFIWNAILAAVARLFTYAPVCAAVILLRHKRPETDAFRLPMGWLFALAGAAFCVVLILQMGEAHLRIIAIVAAVGTLNWLVVRK